MRCQLIGSNASAVRAVLKKTGVPDVQFELRRTRASECEMIENGRVVGLFFRDAGLGEAWEKCISQRYPGYQVSNLEEWVPD